MHFYANGNNKENQKPTSEYNQDLIFDTFKNTEN